MDSEYFLPEYMLVYDKLEEIKTEPFKNLCKFIKKGIFDISPELYKTEGIPLIRTTEIKNPLINFDTTVFLDKETHQQFFSTELESNDIVFTKIGANIGDVSLLPDNYAIYNFSQNAAAAKLLKDKNIYPEFLLCFFLSKYGNSQIKRAVMLSGQGKLELEDIRNLAIPSEYFRIKQLCKIMINKIKYLKNEVQNKYKDSSNLISTELKLCDWKPKHELSYVKNFSDVNSANRYDAEYFQPKYDEIIEKIKSYPNGWDTVENIIEINDKNVTPKDSEEYKYIELSNISNNGEITGATMDIGKNLPTRARRFVEAGELIVSSIEGSLDSIALVTAEYNKSFCSNGFYVLKSDFYNSETLLCLLKSIIGQMQLKKGCSGTILTAISKEELNKIILPKIPIDIQNQIKDYIQKMYKLKYQSKQLLEIAKRGVEIAIEENEESAANWINEQLSKIGVEL